MFFKRFFSHGSENLEHTTNDNKRQKLLENVRIVDV
jgi:hypothetical protein